MSDIRTRVWSGLEYKNPRDWLVGLARLEREVVPLVADPRARSFRTNRLRWVNEARQAGLLVYGMEQLEGRVINFAMEEDSDYDFIARFIDGDIDTFVPVQLKEWVPDSINPAQSLQDIYEGLRTYASQEDLTVGIYVCRGVSLNVDDVLLSDTNFKQVWLFGSCSEGRERWFVWGDVQEENPAYFEFNYPTE